MKEYNFKINDNVLKCLNVAIKSDDSQEIYEQTSKAISETLELNYNNGFSFSGFYPKDTYLIGNYKEINELQKVETEPIALLCYIFANRSSIQIDIKKSTKLNSYEFVLFG